MKFYCTHCGQRLKAEEEHYGKRIGCPSCGKEIIVPGGDGSHGSDPVAAISDRRGVGSGSDGRIGEDCIEDRPAEAPPHPTSDSDDIATAEHPVPRFPRGWRKWARSKIFQATMVVLALVLAVVGIGKAVKKTREMTQAGLERYWSKKQSGSNRDSQSPSANPGSSDNEVPEEVVRDLNNTPPKDSRPKDIDRGSKQAPDYSPPSYSYVKNEGDSKAMQRLKASISKARASLRNAGYENEDENWDFTCLVLAVKLTNWSGASGDLEYAVSQVNSIKSNEASEDLKRKLEPMVELMGVYGL